MTTTTNSWESLLTDRAFLRGCIQTRPVDVIVETTNGLSKEAEADLFLACGRKGLQPYTDTVRLSQVWRTLQPATRKHLLDLEVADAKKWSL